MMIMTMLTCQWQPSALLVDDVDDVDDNVNGGGDYDGYDDYDDCDDYDDDDYLPVATLRPACCESFPFTSPPRPQRFLIFLIIVSHDDNCEGGLC